MALPIHLVEIPEAHPVITLKLLGGAGNQLFIWAFGQALEARGHKVVFDRSLLDASECRSYLLPQFGIHAEEGNGGGVELDENSLRYNPACLLRPPDVDCVLTGYWQSEKYWAGIEQKIRWAVFDNILLEEKTRKVALQILSCSDQSCFIHVRRSDNLHPQGIAFHGLLSAPGNPYYDRAKKLIRLHVPAPHFFVFSDDPAWCHEHMAGPDTTIIDFNPPSFTVNPDFTLTKNIWGREAQDMFLMSLCRHAIIGNSTFSWWGAWLHVGGDLGSVVVAPEEWFASQVPDSTDIVPHYWYEI